MSGNQILKIAGLGGAAAATAIYFLGTGGHHDAKPLVSTPGTQNIEKAYTNGGGSATGQPAYGTHDRKRGDPEGSVGPVTGSGVKEHMKDVLGTHGKSGKAA